jgi:hypothetical protein
MVNISVKTTLFPKPPDLLFGLKTAEMGKREKMIHINTSDTFSKYITSYSDELI